MPSTSILSKRDGLKEAGAKKAEWRGYTSQAMFRAEGDSNAVPLEPGFHRRTLSGQGAVRPLTPDTKAFRPCGTLTKGQCPLEPANQSRAVPGTLAHPSAGWNRASVKATLDWLGISHR